ncbi:MAG: phosphoenolpyruvate carboxykinase, partial [Deltaproteobacteria bacterium]
MLQKNEGVDIIQEIGGIRDVESALACFEHAMDNVHFKRIQTITHSDVLLKIANAIAMCQPDDVFVNTGSEADRQFIRDLALKKGEEAPLPMPRHTIHFDLKDEQGRIIDRTYYIANPDEDVSSLANRMDRRDALNEVREKMSAIMKGKTMMVGFYIRGPFGSPVSNPALEITSSA